MTFCSWYVIYRQTKFEVPSSKGLQGYSGTIDLPSKVSLQGGKEKEIEKKGKSRVNLINKI